MVTVPTTSDPVLINSNTTVNVQANSSAGAVTLSGNNARIAVQTDNSLTASGITYTGASGNDVRIYMDAGTLNLNGGAGSIATTGGVNSQLHVNGNVTLNLASANLTYLWLKSGGSGPAQLSITNGQNFTAVVTYLAGIPASGQSTLNINGGTLNAGTMIFNVTGGAYTNAFNLNSGGLLTADTIRRDYDGSSVTFNWNDGTIQNRTNSALTISRGANATQNMVLSLAGTGTHTFNADSGRTITVASTATLADKAGEQGTLVKAGAGELIFQGTNTYTGLTTINAGTLTLSSGSAIADSGAVTLANASGATLAINSSETIGSLRGGGSTGGNVSVASGQTLTVAETANQTFAGAITNAGALTKSGVGTTRLSGANTYSGATTIAAGTLQIGDGGTTGAIGSTSGIAISNGATLAFNRSDSYGGNFTRTITGAGGVALSAGTLTLQNTGNNFTGGVTVNGGTFRTLGNSAGSNIVVNSGGTFAMAGTDTWGSAGIMSSPAVTINSGGTMTSDGQFNTLRNLTMNGGSVNLNGGLASAGAFVLGGTVTAGGATTSTISASGGANNFIRLGREGVIGGVTEFNVADTAGQLSVGVELTNNFGASTAGLTKSGSGKMLLSASNTYTGPTAVTAGTLQVGNGGTTGSISANSALSVSNGATLAFNRTDNYGGASTHTISGAGTVAINGGNLTLNAAGSSGYSTNLSFVVNNGATATMGHSDMFGGTGWDATTSPGFTVNAGGTLASSNNFNTLWNLNLNGGTLLANGGANTPAQAFALAGAVTVGGSSASLIQAGTNGNGLNNINISGNGNSTLTFNVADATGNANADLTITANLQNSRSTLSNLNKTGSGTMVLAGTNSYTGATTVNAGLLKVLSGGSISSSSTTVNNGGTLDVGGTAGNVQVNSGGLLKGSGSVGAFTLASGGTLAPGNSPGTLTAASAIVLGGSTYNWEIKALTGTAGTTWDLFSVGGLLDMSGVTSGNKWNLVVTGDSGFAGWTDTSSYSYVFAQAASVSGFSSTVGTDVTSLFNITTSGIASKPNASFNVNGDFKVVVGSANGVTTLNLMAVPEPSTGSMLGLGLAGLVVTRLLRRKSS